MDVHAGHLFSFACPPQYASFIYLHIGPAPCRQTENRRRFSFAGIGFFANTLYLDRMPLGFVTFSSPDEPVTLSPVTLALRHLSKNAVFDAKPPFSEGVTLSPPKLFFVNRPFVPPRRQILNVTALNIFLSVK